MQPLIWDQYGKVARLSLTALFLGLALIPIFAGMSGWAVLPILCAAIAFHTEYKLIVYPDRRTFEKRILVKPFGQPVTGSLDEIESIRVSTWTSETGTGFEASFVWPNGKYDPPTTFRVRVGSLTDILREVERITKATGLPVAESDEFRKARESYAAASSLIQKIS